MRELDDLRDYMNYGIIPSTGLEDLWRRIEKKLVWGCRLSEAHDDLKGNVSSAVSHAEMGVKD